MELGHRHIEGGPTTGLVLALSKRQVSLRPADCPTSFREDMESYFGRLAGKDVESLFADDIFGDDVGRICWRRPIKATTIRLKSRLLRTAAQTLITKGLDPTLLRTLRDLVEPEDRVKTVLKHQQERFRDRDSDYPYKIAEELRLLARDHCRLGKEAVDKIALWAKRLRRPQRLTLTSKNKRRLRALIQLLPRAMLLEMPNELMRRADKEKSDLTKAARLAMYAAALEILLV
jgi:hypothetical protein